MYHGGIGYLEQQTICQASPRGDRTPSSESTEVPPAVLKLPGQQGGRGGSSWRHTYRTDVYTRQKTGRSGIINHCSIAHEDILHNTVASLNKAHDTDPLIYLALLENIC